MLFHILWTLIQSVKPPTLPQGHYLQLSIKLALSHWVTRQAFFIATLFHPYLQFAHGSPQPSNNSLGSFVQRTPLTNLGLSGLSSTVSFVLFPFLDIQAASLGSHLFQSFNHHFCLFLLGRRPFCP
ncbi:hypothetical protein HCH54_009329 [Aspergillus fumigatus]